MSPKKVPASRNFVAPRKYFKSCRALRVASSIWKKAGPPSQSPLLRPTANERRGIPLHLLTRICRRRLLRIFFFLKTPRKEKSPSFQAPPRRWPPLRGFGKKAMERSESVLRASRSLGTRALLLAEWPRSTRVVVHNFHRHQNKFPMSPKHGRSSPRIVDGVPSEMLLELRVGL